MLKYQWDLLFCYKVLLNDIVYYYIYIGDDVYLVSVGVCFVIFVIVVHVRIIANSGSRTVHHRIFTY